MPVLVINSGSSSVKYQLIELPSGKRLQGGKFERIAEAGGEFSSHREALQRIVSEIGELPVEAVGHRSISTNEMPAISHQFRTSSSVAAKFWCRSSKKELVTRGQHFRLTFQFLVVTWF